MVTSEVGRSWLLALTPQWMVYLPVISAARLGAHVTPAAYQRRKIVPCEASRSRFGVAHSVRPLNPTSPQPRSSARISTTLGDRESAAIAGGLLRNATRIAATQARRHFMAGNVPYGAGRFPNSADDG